MSGDLQDVSPLPLSRRAAWSVGQPISDLMQRALARPELISLAAGFVDQQTLPVEATRDALAALFNHPHEAQAALQYGTTPGYAPLRDMILARHLAADGQSRAETGLTAERVVLSAGSNQMLHLVSESLLDPGDFVCCGAPSYFVYLGLLKNLGVRPLGVEVDDCGMVPESLEEMLDRQDKGGHLARTKAVYLVSYFDNPCSLTLAAERRATIVEMARRWSRGGAAGHRVYVIEDAAYRELRYDGDDVASLRAADPDGRTVIHTGTFSKSFSPGVRVGWGILPAELVEPVCNQKGNIDFGSPNFNQYLMAKVLDEGVYEPHVAQIRASYREKLQAMLAACREHLGGMPQVDWIQPRGGLYVWLTLPDAIDAGPAGPLFQQALDRGVLYVPGQYFFPGEGAARRANTIRLSFGVQPPDKIHHGVQALAEAIDAL